ncbi:MAG: phosphoribosylamine--glycine ligase [Candidatus Omnitrophota bacterium]
MKVLVIGSGGREHALVWKIAQSKKVSKIFCAPGSAGISRLAENVAIQPDDIKALAAFAKKETIDLTVVGPEAPLVLGVVDVFTGKGLRIFGPTKELANLEGSKIYAKELMRKYGVPTAEFKIFSESAQARSYLETRAYPIVVKADGLCAGKGVFVCRTAVEAARSVKEIMDDKVFGGSGGRIIIEECLAGEEASIIVVSDGRTALPMASSQDHKRVYDGDEGPNTGGMGAYSPAPVITDDMFSVCMRSVIDPVISALAGEGKPFKGVLYAGVMVTSEGPKVLEFNVRFGDPETQAILPRLASDLVEIIERSIDGSLAGFNASWDGRPCVSVVMASDGYPGAYKKGKEITGLFEANALPDTVIFHAGTKAARGGRFITDGGRVLNVTALGGGIKKAIDNCYTAVEKIRFDGAHYRKDIGGRALRRLREPQT